MRRLCRHCSTLIREAAPDNWRHAIAGLDPRPGDEELGQHRAEPMADRQPGVLTEAELWGGLTGLTWPDNDAPAGAGEEVEASRG